MKVNIVKYNPVAENILATAGFDFLIKIWNVSSGEEVAVLQVREIMKYWQHLCFLTIR